MVNDNVSSYLIKMNNLRCALKSIQSRLDEVTKENIELNSSLKSYELDYEKLQKDYEKLTDERDEAIWKWRHNEETIKKAISYIKGIMIQEGNIDEIVRLYLDNWEKY